MDRSARETVIGQVGKGIAGLLLLALPLAAAGCHWGWHGGSTPPPSPGEIARDNAVAAPEWLHPAVAADGAAEVGGDGGPGAGEGKDAPTGLGPPIDNAIVAEPAVGPAATGDAASGTAAAPTASVSIGGREEASAGGGEEPSKVPAPSVERPVSPPPDGTASGAGNRAKGTPSARKTKPAAAETKTVPSSPPKEAPDAPPPGWAKRPEELVYRVDFIGITMGYARFRYQGKVSIAGKPAYHLNVRAWTSGVLSHIFPINETIDYYLDTETLAPIRQEFTEVEREKDDVALYDQATGKITYRYRRSGKIRRQVDTVPCVYDPVSVAYYFRWRDLGFEDRPRNMYGGRKLYQISSRILGNERIRTEHGEIDTIAVLPVIRRDGKPDSKGDLKIWFSNDERRVPVRLYAKFHKIKDWTLVGELIPPAGKAGG